MNPYGCTEQCHSYQDHFDGLATFYFQGNGRKWDRFSMAIIDVDVQKAQGLGSTRGAHQFVSDLRAHPFLRNLVGEPSNGGKGLGCPILIEKYGYGPEEVNKAIERLDAWLKWQHRIHGADIEAVEVMGKSPVTKVDGYRYTSVKYGTFARIPRKLTIQQLKRLPVIPLWRLLSHEFDVPDEAVRSSPDAIRETPVTPSRKSCGSLTGLPMSARQRDQIPAAMRGYRPLAERFAALYQRGEGAARLTCEDFMVALTILSIIALDPADDHQLRCVRVEGIWKALHRLGLTDRAWCCQRWAAIRNLLADAGVLNLVDKTCYFGQYQGKGYGKAMQWFLKPEYVFDFNREEGERHPICQVLPSFVFQRWRPFIVFLLEPNPLDPNELCEWPDPIPEPKMAA
ncbi:MAG: hypothetical protein ACJ780_04870, partial [Solirubrobacteraceae bacterium]